MALPRFTFEPSYATSGESELRMTEMQMGDGYVQRTPSGINNRKMTISVVFNKRTAEEIAAIDAFLTAMGGQPFLWTPPPPKDWDNAPAFVPNAAYIQGQAVKVSTYFIYVALVANSDQDTTDTEHWAFLGKVPMQFVCKKGNWAADSFNSNSLTATFEQDFTPA
jgi:phage-related protein